MYKIWDIESIRNYMKELEIKSGFKLPNNIPIEIKNFKRYLGVTYEEYNDDNKIYIKKFAFCTNLLDGFIPDEEVKDVICHEFCHAWADTNEYFSHNHGEKFIICCEKLNCNPDKCTKSDIIHKGLKESKEYKLNNNPNKNTILLKNKIKTYMKSTSLKRNCMKQGNYLFVSNNVRTNGCNVRICGKKNISITITNECKEFDTHYKTCISDIRDMLNTFEETKDKYNYIELENNIKSKFIILV